MKENNKKELSCFDWNWKATRVNSSPENWYIQG